MTCTAVTPEMWLELMTFLVKVLPFLCVSCLLVGQMIWFGFLAPWITRRTSASLVDLMQNEKALARLVRIRARRLQQSEGGLKQC